MQTVKLLRLLPSLVFGLAAAMAVLAWGARTTEASGVVTTCDDGGLSTALTAWSRLIAERPP